MTTSNVYENLSDFVIIGGGTAGCVIATRLAEYGFETLLITSGLNDLSNPLIREMSQFLNLLTSSDFKHHIRSTPAPNLNPQMMEVIAFNTLGGSSINGGGMQRMAAKNWQLFVDATGDSSYDIEHMSKYYKRIENFTSTGAVPNAEIHGKNGPIKLTHVYDPMFDQAWKNVANELNEIFTGDLAESIDYGFSFEPSASKDGIRSCSADAYLIPAMAKYSNLKVITGATVTKLDLDEETKQVKSVRFHTSDGEFIGIARKEYILSAGAVFSPHLLMLSGIGDPDILKKHDVSVKHILKQVGKNFMDSARLVVKYGAKNLYLDDSKPVALVNTNVKTTSSNSNTFFILKFIESIKQLFVFIYHDLSGSPVGFVTLQDSNPLTPPNLVTDYLKDENDINRYIDSITYLRKIMSTDALKEFGPFIEISPRSEEDLSEHVRKNLQMGHHFTSTCSMGRNAEDSVVDNQFKVHGIGNLRVIDASIYPVGLSATVGPCFTIYALAEKGADAIRQQYS